MKSDKEKSTHFLIEWTRKDFSPSKINKDWVFQSSKFNKQSKRFSKLLSPLLNKRLKKDKILKMIWKSLLEKSSKKSSLSIKKVNKWTSKMKPFLPERSRLRKKWPVLMLISKRKPNKRINKSRNKKKNLWWSFNFLKLSSHKLQKPISNSLQHKRATLTRSFPYISSQKSSHNTQHPSRIQPRLLTNAKRSSWKEFKEWTTRNKWLRNSKKSQKIWAINF